MRKLVLPLAFATVVGLAAGCKDSGPTSMKFDPAKANYSAGPQYSKGAAAGSAGVSKSP